MKKLLLKMFLPKPAELAKIAANAAAQFVNASDKQELISNVAKKIDKITRARELVLKWMADGKFDETEILELQAELEPIMTDLYNRVLEGK